jgi:hypothetical protein
MENLPKSYRDLSEDHKQLYQLARSADVSIDPTLFGHLLQFLDVREFYGSECLSFYSG